MASRPSRARGCASLPGNQFANLWLADEGCEAGFPQSKWHRWDPINRDNMRAGSKLAFGGYYDPIYKFENAAVVVALDADFLSGAWFPGFVRYARDFMRGRKLENGDQMNRLYVAESAPSTTGAKADHRLVLRPSEVENVARALAAKVGVGGTAVNLTPEQQKFVDAVAADLSEHKGKCLVVPENSSRPRSMLWRRPSMARWEMWGRRSRTSIRWKSML